MNPEDDKISIEEPHLVLELPMRMFGRTVHRTKLALDSLEIGQILELRTDDP